MKRLKRKPYEELLEPLQEELVAMARWVAASGQRLVVLFEGRDTAGKGGAIQAVADKLNGKSFVVVRQASETGQLYGSVSARDIASILSDGGYSVTRNQIALHAPIKMIGMHTVPVALHPEVEVTVTVKSVKERELPTADDDFAQLASEFDTLEELKNAVREQAGEYKKVEQGVEARNKLVDHLIATIDIPLPENVIKADIESHFEDGHGDDAHRAEYEAGIEKSLKSQLLLDEIANKEQLQVSEAELVDFLVRQSSQYGMQPDQFVQEVVRSGQTSSFVGEVVRGKALAHVLENANITDASGRVVDLKALTADPAAAEAHDHDDHEGHDH